MSDLEIAYRDPKALVAYARNSRTHTDDQIDKLKASITEYGFTNPILLKDDGKTIGAGHARCRAAVALDLESVPTITLTGLTETQWKSYVIADNQLAITGSGWDAEVLKSELEALMADGFSVDLLGFSADELNGFMNPASDSEADPDEEVIPPLCQYRCSVTCGCWATTASCAGRVRMLRPSRSAWMVPRRTFA